MAAGTQPRWTASPNNGFLNQLIKTGDNSYDGTGANSLLVFTAGANGSYIERIRCVPAGTNIATVLRIWRNNGSSAGSAANNNFIGELTLPATTASATVALTPQELAQGFWLEPNYKLYIGLGTTVAAGWNVQVYGGDY